MTEEYHKIEPGEVYEVTLSDDTWTLITLKKQSDGTFNERDYLFKQKVKTFEVLEKDKVTDNCIMKAIRQDDSELFVEFDIDVFIRYINMKDLKFISKEKENHEGMQYNAYTDKWHWGIL